MKPQSLAMAADQGAGFETHRKRTRRDAFLDTMNATVSWVPLCAVIEVYQTHKGKQWYLGAKVHIGMDSRSGLAHSAVLTPTNAHDKYPSLMT